MTGDVGLGAEAAAAAVELETVAAVDVNRCVAVDGVPVVVVIQPRGEGALSPLLASHCNERDDASITECLSVTMPIVVGPNNVRFVSLYVL